MIPLPLKSRHDLDIRANPNGHGFPIHVIEEKGIVIHGINFIRRFLRIPLYFLLRNK